MSAPIHSLTRIFLWLVAATSLAVAAGCAEDGEDLPSGSVATVGDVAISKQDFDRWVKAFHMGNGQQADAVKAQVMGQLIQAEWYRQEAERRRVQFSAAEARKRLHSRQGAAIFGALQKGGMTEQDVLTIIRSAILQEELAPRPDPRLSEAELRSFYRDRATSFALPEQREAFLILTDKKQDADRALAAVRGGEPWRSVVTDYSVDEETSQPGRQPVVLSKGQGDRALDRAVFDAPLDREQGPVKSPFGWFVFEVTTARPAVQRSFEEVREFLVDDARLAKHQAELDQYNREFRREYRDKTTCAAGFEVPECSNGPDRPAAPTA